MASRIDDDLIVQGDLTAETMSIPSSSIRNAQVSIDAAIQAEKLEHVKTIRYVQDSGADVVSKTSLLYVCRSVNGATVRDFAVTVSTAPTGGDKKFTVDLQKSTGGGAFASILSAVADISSSDSNRSTEVPTLSSTALVQGDILQVVVTASGSTGSQAQGAMALLSVDEFT